MSKELFPAGPWIGFYTYGGPSARYRMDLYLTFSNGKITGDGSDAIGRFKINGSYGETSRECDWIKQYIGRHSVDYHGFAEGKGIWGAWTGAWNFGISHGGFHIWPFGSEAANAESESKELVEPATAVAVPKELVGNSC